MDLSGKTLLVTGAARRIGRELAFSAARSGADIVLHYGQSKDEAQTAGEEIRSLGREVHLLQADLSDVEDTLRLVEQAAQIHPLYGLVNNASIFEPLGWDETTYSDWQRHLQINLTAPFLLSQAFARQLPQGETGRIVNLLDWRALRPGPDHLPYTISKAGLYALTRSLASALAPDITVNGLALGAILPPIDGIDGIDGSDVEKILHNVPAGRWAEVDEVCQAALFLLSGPSYITGEIIYVDGGRHLI
jgi:NAD(P)-dependent dehydrogenase (short-subunit alcohol dehydrogenase family)